jgi:iron(III) transport system substrate-binding protein
MPVRYTRRVLLKSAAALPLVHASPLRAAPPPAETITRALIAAATKEGQLTWYTSADLQLAEKVGKAFEQKWANAFFRALRRNTPPASMCPIP